MSYASHLDTPLLRLSPEDVFTVRDACDGVHIFGGIGSGKMSGSGQALAGAYLRAGMGGLVLCAKPEEVELWLRYAAAHGRSNSVLLFDEGQGFNFLTYELTRQGMGGIGSVTECLMRIVEAARRATGSSGGREDAFWDNATRQLLNYTIPILYAAHGTVTVRDIITFVMAAATNETQAHDPSPQWEQWRRTNPVEITMRRMWQAPAIALDRATGESLTHYWMNDYLRIPEKTRGNILISLSTVLDRFNHGRLHQAFCGRTTLVPEMTLHGAIIIMAMPALTWNADGIIAQQLFKYMWQRAVESRNGLAPHHRDRPVFLWADEAQYFVNSYDSDFLSTCRGSRACVVYLTQTLPTYYAKMGQDNIHAADALVGKFNTQVFHQNACAHTNEFAAKMIGRGITTRNTYSEGEATNHSIGMNAGASTNRGSSSGSSRSYGQGGGSWSTTSGGSSGSGESWGDNRGRSHTENSSRGYNETMDYLIEPGFFGSGLRAGGPANGNRVTALWYKAGARFAANGGYHFCLPTFRQ